MDLTSKPPPPLKPKEKGDLFQRLPAEVRHIIYSYLGYPVAGFIWYDCSTQEDNCKIESHMVCDDENPYVTRHAPGTLEIKARALRIQFSNNRRYGAFSKNLLLRTDGFRRCDYRWLAEDQLLRVGMTIRRELLSLIFDSITACIPWALSDGQITPLDVMSDVPLPRSLHSTIFTYMTSIELQSDGIPRGRKYINATSLVQDTASVRFISAHCPYLEKFKYTTMKLQSQRQRYSDGAIQNFSKATYDLTILCKNLKTVELKLDSFFRSTSRFGSTSRPTMLSWERMNNTAVILNREKFDKVHEWVSHHFISNKEKRIPGYF